LLIAFAACSPSPTATPTATVPAAADVQEVDITTSGLAFNTDAIEVSAGEPVRFQFTTGSHTFTIDELDIDLRTSGGQPATLERTFDEPGEFTFYCAIPGHRDAGMEGTLTVAP
jgi:plastocyanin